MNIYNMQSLPPLNHSPMWKIQTFLEASDLKQYEN